MVNDLSILVRILLQAVIQFSLAANETKYEHWTIFAANGKSKSVFTVSLL